MTVRIRLRGSEVLSRPGVERRLQERFRAPSNAIAELLARSAGARLREVSGGRVEASRTDDRQDRAAVPSLAFDPEFGALGEPERPWRARAIADARPATLRHLVQWLRESLQHIVKSG